MMRTVAARSSGLTVGVKAVTVLYVGLFFWYLNVTFIQPPFADMYSVVQHYLSYRTEGGWWEYLWAAHNEHRPVFLRLLTAFDIEVFSGVSYPFVVTAAIAHVGTAWLLWRECRAGVAGTLGLVLGCLVLMLVLTSVTAVVIAIPIMNNLIHGLAFIVLAIVVFERVEVAGVDGGYVAFGRRATAMLVACLVPFADAVGWAVWPILVWIAWRAGADRKWLWTVVGVGAVLLIVYTRGLSLTLPVSDGTDQEIALAGETGQKSELPFRVHGSPVDTFTRSVCARSSRRRAAVCDRHGCRVVARCLPRSVRAAGAHRHRVDDVFAGLGIARRHRARAHAGDRWSARTRPLLRPADTAARRIVVGRVPRSRACLGQPRAIVRGVSLRCRCVRRAVSAAGGGWICRCF